jgi:hypothetical protein
MISEVEGQLCQNSKYTDDHDNHRLKEGYCASKMHRNPCQDGMFPKHVAVDYQTIASQGQIWMRKMS